MRDTEDHRKVMQLWDQGVTKRDIAQQLDLPYETVRGIVDRYKTLDQFKQQQALDDDTATLFREILTRWERGETKLAIAEQLNISRYMVYVCLERYRTLALLEDAIQSGEPIQAKPQIIAPYGKTSTKYSDDDLRGIVARADSYAQVLKELGIRPAGGNYQTIKRRINALGLDTSHFRSKGWSKNIPRIHVTKIPLDEILVEDSTYTSTYDLKNRLLAEGVFEPVCSRCGLREWQSQPIPLELDHINGNRRDNRLENLRLLCPNCHALTPTYRGKNITLDD